jgi:hypothetical protein
VFFGLFAILKLFRFFFGCRRSFFGGLFRFLGCSLCFGLFCGSFGAFCLFFGFGGFLGFLFLRFFGFFVGVFLFALFSFLLGFELSFFGF